MDKDYSFIANSGIMLLFCSLAIVVVLIQAVVFMRTAWKRALELGYTKKDLLKVVKSSAIFSIVPSLPIIISYMILLPSLGTYFPWLRLSVIGSATYETMAANMAATNFGLKLGDNFSPQIFGSLLWVVTMGIFLSSCSSLLLKTFDKKMQSVTAKPNSFGAIVPSIMFVGMMATISAPYFIDVTNIPSVVTIVVSAGAMIGLNAVGKKLPAMKEFAFPLSMVAGMASACLVTALLK